MAKLLSALPVGSVVKSTNTKYNGKVIRWIAVSYTHLDVYKRQVQNFVTLTPTVAVEAQISEKVDVDEVVERIESKLEDEFTAAAEGVYN